MNDMDELRELWERPGFQSGYRDWRSDRVAFAAGFEPEVESFMAGCIDSKELSEKALAWKGQGFQGNGQMFFDQLVRWFETGELDLLLRDVLDPPVDGISSELTLQHFREAISEVLLSGRGIEHRRVVVDGAIVPVGLPDLSTRRVNFFSSFFWGASHPDGWPVMFPSGRDALVKRNLLTRDLSEPELYSSYCYLIDGVKAQLGIDSWAVEFLLWELWRSSA